MPVLPEYGVKIVAQNAAKSTSQVNAFNKSVGNLGGATSSSTRLMGKMTSTLKGHGKATKTATTATSKMSDALKNNSGAIDAVARAVRVFSPRLASMISNIKSAVVALGGLATALIATAAAVAVLVGATALGKAGAKLELTGQAFSNATAGFIDAGEALEMLRKQTRGTMSDQDLLRISTRMLVGTNAMLRETLLGVTDGQLQLGKAIEVTRRFAKVAGISEVELLNRVSLAFRTKEKRRLDDIGITIDAIQAYKDYAKEIGKTVAELSEAEKQVAFTTQALEEMDRVLEQLPFSKVLDSFDQVNAALKNMRDKMAISFVPIADVVGEGIASFMKSIESVTNIIFPIVRAITEWVAAAWRLGEALMSLTPMMLMIKVSLAVIRPILLYTAAAFILFAEAATAAINFVAAQINAIVKGIGDAVNKLFGGVGKNINSALQDIAFNVGKGGAQIIGAFAAGLLEGGTYVVQAVTIIAQIVADFLTGFSPAKMGPLSLIDVGAANLARAWVKGFVGGITESFGEVLAFVDMRLGEIGGFTRAQVEGRLTQLDVAIQPFKDSLSIIKADMEAIAGFIDPAVAILDRQRKKVLSMFESGRDAGIENLRLLDRQIESLEELGEYEQDRVDRAKLQLALAQSTQSQERALLAIQLQRLGPKPPKGKKPPKGPKGAGAAADDPAQLGAQPFTPGEPLDLLFNQDLEDAKRNIIDVLGAGAEGVAAGMAESGFQDALGGFNESVVDLGTEMDRIGDADPVKAITDKFNELPEKFTELFDGIKTTIKDAFANPFGDADPVKAITSPFSSMPATIGGLFEQVKTIVTTTLENLLGNFDPVEAITGPFSSLPNTVGGLFEQVKIIVTTTLGQLFEGFDPVESIMGAFSGLSGRLAEVFNGAKDTVMGIFDSIFGSGDLSIRGVINGFIGFFDDAISVVFGFSPSSIVSKVSRALKATRNLFKNVFGLNAADSITKYVSAAFGKLIDLYRPLFGIGAGSLSTKVKSAMSTIKNAFKSLFSLTRPANIYNTAKETLDKLKQLFLDVFSPDVAGAIAHTVITSLNAIKDIVSEVFGGVTGGIGDILEGFAGGIVSLFGGGGDEGDEELGDDLEAIIDGIKENFSTVFGQIFTNDDSIIRLAMVDFKDVFETGFNDLFGDSGTITLSLMSFEGSVALMVANVIASFSLFTGTGEGTLMGALSTMGAVLDSAFVAPASTAMDALIGLVEKAINTVIAEILKSSLLGMAARELGLGAIKIERITKAEKGALGLSGTFLAGERGPELITASKPVNVFPAAATSALQSIAAQPTRTGVGRASTDNRTTNNSNMAMNNTYNVRTPQQALLIQRQQLALLRR